MKTDWKWLLDEVEGASLVALVEQATAKLDWKKKIEIAWASECMADAVKDLGIPIETLVDACKQKLEEKPVASSYRDMTEQEVG